MASKERLIHISRVGDRICIMRAERDPHGFAEIVKFLPLPGTRITKEPYKLVTDTVGDKTISTGGLSGAYVMKVVEKGVEKSVHLMYGCSWARAMVKHHSTLLELRLLETKNKPQTEILIGIRQT